jgi:hypothetical protein
MYAISEIFKKLPKENNRPTHEKSLVTLFRINCPLVCRAMSWNVVAFYFMSGAGTSGVIAPTFT